MRGSVLALPVGDMAQAAAESVVRSIMDRSDEWNLEEVPEQAVFQPAEGTTIEPGGAIWPPPSAVTEELAPPKRRGCWFKGLALVAILSMLGSVLITAVWVWDQARANGDAFPLSEISFSPINATPERQDNGRIAYIDQTGQVVTVDPDGSNARTLTDATFRHQFPAWAPDGQQLAVIAPGAIYLLPDTEANAEPLPLYTNNSASPFYVYWSPDGRFLSFLTNEAQQSIGLRLLAVENPQAERLLTTGAPVYWNWAADSRQMLIHTGSRGEAAQLALLNTEITATEQIAPPGFFQAPGISANGRYWAYAEDLGDGTSWLVVHDQESEQQWTQRHTGMVALSWSPSGSKLAFTTGARERSTTFWGPLRLFDAASGETTFLSDNTVLGFFWSPDSRYLATIHTGANNRDFGTNAMIREPGRPLPLAKPNPQQRSPHEFHLTILDVSNGAEILHYPFSPTVLFISQLLPFFDQYALSHRIWSPAGDAVVLPVLENRTTRIKVIPINGDPALDLGRGDMSFWSP